MTERDLTRILTEHVADAHLPDEAMRRIRLAAKEEKPVKKKMRLAVVLVMLLMLLISTTAIASHGGLLDFLAQRFGFGTLPDTHRIIPSTPITCETNHATFTVKEALCDGIAVTVQLEIVPKDGVLLVDANVTPEQIASDLGSHLSYTDYAAAHGLTAVQTTLHAPGSNHTYWRRQGMNLSAVISFAVPEGAESVTLRCHTGSYDTSTAKLEIPIISAEPLWQASIAVHLELPELNSYIERIDLIGTPLQLYAEMVLTPLDAERSIILPNYTFTDTRGNELAFNAITTSTYRPIPDSNQYILTSCYEPFADKPEALTLQLEPEEGETTAIALDIP